MNRLSTTLLILAFFLPGSAYALDSTTFCPTSGVTQCDTDADCTGDDHCTRSWNQGIEWMVGATFGHCVDVNGAANAEAAIQADLCTLPDPKGYTMGIPYNLPPNGHLLFDDHDSDGVSLHVYRRTILEGNGCVIEVDNPASSSTELVGLRFITGLSTNSEEYADPDENASWSAARDLTIRSQTDADSAMVGIQVQAHGVRLDNIKVQAMGTGIEVDGASTQGNANKFQFSNLYLSGHYDYGMYIHGADSNAGFIRGIETSGGVGVRDSSFLGNVWVGASSEGNDKTSGTRSKKISFEFDGGSNSVVATGLYVESGDASPEVGAASAVFLGGNAIRLLSDSVDRVGYGKSRLTFKLNFPATGHNYKVYVPGTASASTAGAMFMQQDDTENWGWGLRIQDNMWGWHSEATSLAPAYGWRSYNSLSSSTDYPAGAADVSSRRITEEGACTDGVDNDNDSSTDGADSGC